MNADSDSPKIRLNNEFNSTKLGSRMHIIQTTKHSKAKGFDSFKYASFEVELKNLKKIES